MGLQGVLFYNNRLYILASGICFIPELWKKNHKEVFDPHECVLKCLTGARRHCFTTIWPTHLNVRVKTEHISYYALPLPANRAHGSPALLLLIWKPLLRYHLNLYLACNSLLWQAHFHRLSLVPTLNFPFGRTINMPFFHATLNTYIPSFINSITNILSCFHISKLDHVNNQWHTSLTFFLYWYTK